MALSRYLDRLRGKPQEYFQNSLFLCFSLCYENTIVCSLGTSVEVPRYICSSTSLTMSMNLTLVRPFFPAVVKSTVRAKHSCTCVECGFVGPPRIGSTRSGSRCDLVVAGFQHGLKTLHSNSHTASVAYSRLGIPLCSFSVLSVSRYFSNPKMSSDFA